MITHQLFQPKLIAVTLAMFAAAAAADDRETSAKVRELIEQLSSDAIQQRVAAEQQLRSIGPAALRHLPNPRTLEAGPAEAVQRVRAFLERQQARSALEPRRVTLTGTRPLREILDAVATQTGNMLDVSTLTDHVLERETFVDFHHTTFWEAVSSLEKQANVTFTTMNRDALAVMSLTEETPQPVSVSIAGVFRILAGPAHVRPDFVNPDRRLLRLTLELQAEPRLRPLFVYVSDDALTVTAGEDDEPADPPRPFPPLSPEASREIPVDKPGPIQFTHDVIIPLAADDQPISSVPFSSLTVGGRIEVEIAAGRERFEFPNLDDSGPITRRHGGVSVTLDDIKQTGSDWQASLRIAYDADAPHFESHRAWVFHNDIQLILHEKQLAPAESETLAEGDDGVTLRYRFADAAPLPEDALLQYTAPTLVTRMPVEFSLSGVTVAE